MRSALFIDFDNIYSGLRRLEPAYAERFAQRPIEWIEWLERDLELPEYATSDAGRRLLVRRVYLNPQVYQRFRPSFNRAGFEIVDCPPMTSDGKTSTDIHMVLDVMELLAHPTHFDEFIVFSADADFTPVLRKLRRWDRRTTVLAVGFPSAAYQASADLLIDQDVFVAEALGFGDNGAPVQATKVLASGAGGWDRAGGQERTSADHEAQLVAYIRERVQQSPTPVPLPRFATELPSKFDFLSDKTWMGKGSFRPFIDALKLQPLRIQWMGGGFISDPLRHRGEAALRSLWGKDANLLLVARQVHEAVGTPLLMPAQMQSFFEALRADLRDKEFDLSETGKRIRDRTRDRGASVSRADVNWLLKGLLLAGIDFAAVKQDEALLVETMVQNLLALSRREQLSVDADFESRLRRWLGSERSN